MSGRVALNLGIPELFFGAVSSAIGNSSDWSLPARATQVTWQTSFAVAPASITVQLLTSLDGITFTVVDTSTSVSGESRNVLTSALFIRARINAISGGSGITVEVVAKDYTVQNVTQITFDIGATFLTVDDETGGFPNSRILIAGLNISSDDTVSGERTINFDGTTPLSAVEFTGPNGKVNILSTGTTKWFNVGELSAGSPNTVTTNGVVSTVNTIGNGIAIDATGTITPLSLDQMYLFGASLSVTYTDAGTTSDITLIGEHMTITDENAPQGYGLGMGGGGADIDVSGGERWIAIAGGSGGNIIADFLTDGVILGCDIRVVNVDNLKTRVNALGRKHRITNTGGVYTFGDDITVRDVGNTNASDSMYLGVAISANGNSNAGNTQFGFGYGHSFGGHQLAMLLGFNGSSQGDNTIGIGHSTIPEVVVGVGVATINGNAVVTGTITGGTFIPVTGYKSVDLSSGISTTITTGSLVGKTITVKNGLITAFA